eukprot:1010098-Pelagomonas_calceolata.AAC.1
MFHFSGSWCGALLSQRRSSMCARNQCASLFNLSAYCSPVTFLPTKDSKFHSHVHTFMPPRLQCAPIRAVKTACPLCVHTCTLTA